MEVNLKAVKRKLCPGDVTLIAWGAMLAETMQAASALSERGIEATVIDVATLKPPDEPAIIASVGKTGRCVIVHEAPLTAGFGAEIAARVSEHALTSLLAPVRRVTGYDTVMPLSRLEEHYLPSVARITRAAEEAMAFA